jgi:hypothetical protein
MIDMIDDHMTGEADVLSVGQPDPKFARGRPSRKGRGRTSPAAILRWERDYKCVKMRLAECDWQTIVETLGYSSTGHAHDQFMSFMREYPRDDVEAMRNLELDRLEKTCRALQPRIDQGDPRACEVWNKLSERRAKLMGLDKPERRELTVLTEDVIDRAIREATEAMERSTAAAQEAGIELPADD